MGKYDNMTDAEMRAELERRDETSHNPYEKVVGWTTTTDKTKLTSKKDGIQYDVWKGERYTEKGVSAIFLIKSLAVLWSTILINAGQNQGLKSHWLELVVEIL